MIFDCISMPFWRLSCKWGKTKYKSLKSVLWFGIEHDSWYYVLMFFSWLDFWLINKNKNGSLKGKFFKVNFSSTSVSQTLIFCHKSLTVKFNVKYHNQVSGQLFLFLWWNKCLVTKNSHKHKISKHNWCLKQTRGSNL